MKIDAEVLINEIIECASGEAFDKPTWSVNAIINLIHAIPQEAIPCNIPIKDNDGAFKCAHCGNIVSRTELVNGYERFYADQFCPQCGTKQNWNKVENLHKKESDSSEPFVPEECADCSYYECEEVPDGDDWKWVYWCSKGKEHDWANGVCPDFE